jgi:hypothetical protein
MIPIQWAISSFPGQKQQEGSGRLVNVFAEPRGSDLGPVWRRVPGARVFARTPSAGSAAGGSSALGVSSVVAVAGSASGDASAGAVGATV